VPGRRNNPHAYTAAHELVCVCVCECGKTGEIAGEKRGKTKRGKWAWAEVSERWTGIKSLFYAVV